MKFFIAFSAVIAVVSASGLYYSPEGLLVRAAFQSPVQQQYHAQDEFGQYSYGYSEPLSAKQEVKTLDGVTRGSYSYRDAEGKLQTVDYTADAGGFRVSATNLPKPVQAPEVIPAAAPLPVAETPEVAAARIAHLAAIEEAKTRSRPVTAAAIAPALDRNDLPRPVEDTPEVARAKAEHFNAVENAKLRNAVIKEGNEVHSAFSVPAVPTASPVRYVSGGALSLPIPLAYRSVVLPSGFAYSYGLNGALVPSGRFLSAHYIQQ